MTPSAALACVVVDELARCGVRDVVLCPGSRSAPLAYAVVAAERAGRLRLHVRVDERAAGFLALGLGKATGRPAVVLTTSGTAVANLHPSVLEAHEAGIPLLLLTADRPPELRGTRANQTTDQAKVFGSAVRWFHDLGAPDHRAGQQAAWRTGVDRAVAAALATLGGDPGPVHLNVPLRDPLAPDETLDLGPTGPFAAPAKGWPEALAGRPDRAPWTVVRGPSGTVVGEEGRTVVVLGDLAGDLGADGELSRRALEVAAARGWPVVAEPFGRGERPGVIPHGPLVLSVPDLLEHAAPRRILLVGRVTLSRATAALLRTPGVRVEAVTDRTNWADPSHVVQVVRPWSVLGDLRAGASVAGGPTPELAPVDGLAAHTSTDAERQATAVASADRPQCDGADGADGDEEWRQTWARAGERLDRAVEAWLADGWPTADAPTGPVLAHAVLAALPADATLFVGSSNSARDVEVARGRQGPFVAASRGLAGIDGCVSSAAGLALARPGMPTYALLGDLTFLHDGNGLLIGPDEPVPDLTIVVADDGGGGIFSTLEYGEPARRGEDRAGYERVFATPTRVDVSALCAAHGVGYARVERRTDLTTLLARAPRGLRVLHVPIRRDSHRDAYAALRELAATVLLDP